MKILFALLIFLAGYAWLIQTVRADYAEQLNGQILDIESHAGKMIGPEYFHDMGIVARKADDSGLADLTLQIVREKLLAPMDEYVKSEAAEINRLYETDPLAASRRLKELNSFERYYEPSENFLKTAAGQTLAAELSLKRRNAQGFIATACSESALVQALQIMKKTGLFQTRQAEEINSMREITRLLDCCLAWKPKINYRSEKLFENDYEQGTSAEEAHLLLQTNARDYNEASWTGEWTYHFTGRKGKGEGRSTAVLKYKRGSETADLVISASRLSSVGRINFPVTLEGEPRTLNVEANGIFPKAYFSADQEVPMAGCQESKNVR